MRKVKINVTDIVSFLGDLVIGVSGKLESVYIDNLADVEHVNKHTLDWINPSKQNKQELAKKSKAIVLLVDNDIHPIPEKTLIIVKNPKMALAKIGNHFFVDRPKPEIHPTAIIDPEAIIGLNVSIGAYCVIGKAVIGDDCVLDSCVRVYDDTVLGKGCAVKNGAVLGGAGFGFERDEKGNKFRFPQIGRLIIGDDVEIGANTCIDRGALSETIIGDHTKINNLCHIAHNNRIGRNVTITGCVNISGSSVIDDDVWVAPNSSIRGFLHIGRNSVVGMGSVVTKDIPAGETWVGNPAKKMK